MGRNIIMAIIVIASAIMLVVSDNIDLKKHSGKKLDIFKIAVLVWAVFVIWVIFKLFT